MGGYDGEVDEVSMCVPDLWQTIKTSSTNALLSVVSSLMYWVKDNGLDCFKVGCLQSLTIDWNVLTDLHFLSMICGTYYFVLNFCNLT